MSNNGIPPLNDWQSDNYPVIYDEGASELQYVKTGAKTTINTGGSSYLVASVTLTDAQIKTLRLAPVDLVDAAGIGKIIVPLFAIFDFTWLANYDNFDVNSFMAIEYESNNGAILSRFQEAADAAVSALFAASESRIAYLLPPTSIVSPMIYTKTDCVNKKLQLITLNDVGDLTNGNAGNSLKIIVYYVVVDL